MLRRVKGYLKHQSSDAAPAESRLLEEQGYCLIKNVLTADGIHLLANEISKIYDAWPGDNRAGDRRSVSDDDCFRYEMLNRGERCQTVINDPKIKAVLSPLLGHDFHLIANTAWRNPPNQNGQHGGQAWHIDAGPHVPLPEGVSWPMDIPHPVFAVGAHIYLEDCGLKDGPTGVIPGSHLSGQFPPIDQLMDDELSFNHRGVEPLLAKAGDVAMFVSDVWHRRMPTAPGEQGRFFLQAHYGRRDIAQRLRTTEQANQLSEATIARAKTAEQQSIIGLHPAMFYDG